MKKARVLLPILSALVLANVTAARAGAYGETGTAEESPHAAPPASLVADEEEEGWTFVITPQLWAPHIDSGGFAGNSNLQTVSNVLAANGISDGRFKGANSEAVDDLDLQWGFQLGAKKGRWAIGLSYQSSDFETRTDMVYHGTGFSDPNVGSLSPGEVAAQEFVNTSRTDVDFAMSYTFPDVMPNRLDLAAGLGLKMIYADSVRYYSNLNQFVATVNAIPPPGLYDICHGGKTCDDGTGVPGAGEKFDQRVKSTTWMYGATIPLTAVLHLTEDAKWLLPISVAPFLGAETRDDHHVIYKVNHDAAGFATTVDRQDGTFFAYGVTADARLSWALSDSLSAYLGMRVQYMNGDSPNSDAYLAYGPLLGISASFHAG
jgi:hypothetical protein